MVVVLVSLSHLKLIWRVNGYFDGHILLRSGGLALRIL